MLAHALNRLLYNDVSTSTSLCTVIVMLPGFCFLCPANIVYLALYIGYGCHIEYSPMEELSTRCPNASMSVYDNK